MVLAYAKAVWRETSLLQILFYSLLLLLLGLLLINTSSGAVIEGLAGGEKKFTLKQGPAIYDPFYVSIYDDLLFSKVKNDFEVDAIQQHTQFTKDSRVLDVGSGCGHHVSSLVAHGAGAAQGLDLSPSMVQRAQQTYPALEFQAGDALDSAQFSRNSFTHITCLYFTVYYFADQATFFQNCFYWLMPGGFLALHLVNPAKFDPILPAGDPFGIISPQNYVEDRITSTVVNFDQFDYKSDFKLLPPTGLGEGIQDVNATLTETFKNKTSGKVRKNLHELYMPKESVVLALAKSAGFIVASKVEMTDCQYAHQYVYFLQKPT